MSILLGLSQNIALLISLIFIYGLIDPRLKRFSPRIQDLLKGILFGGFGIVSMLFAIPVLPGFFIDGRTIIVIVATLFGSPFSGILTAVILAVFRVAIGGVGATSGVAGIIAAVLLGILIRRYYQARAAQPSAKIMMLAGVAQALFGASLALLLGIGLDVLLTTLPITILLYPIGILFIGTVLMNQQHSRAMEIALHKDRQRFLAIFNTAFQLTVLFKPDGTVMEANQAALDFGDAKLEDVVGRHFWATGRWSFPPEKQQQLTEAFRRAAEGEFVRFEIELQNAKQQWSNIDFSLKPILDEAGRIEMILLEGRDITTLKQLEAQKVDLLLETERAGLLKKFISDVSHDLRTPLAVMRLNLDLLKRTSDPVKQQQRIETLAGQEEHLTQLLTDMTTMVSFDDSKATFRFKTLDPYFVAQLVFDEHHNAAHNKRQKLLFNRATEPMLIQADQSELERALNKLYDNALTYTPPDGIITLSVFPHDNHAIFELRDTGIGISEADLPEIFNRFFRADVSRNMHTGGAGLGLSIAKKIAEVHGGTIEAESTLGKGSTFRLVLPLITPETQPTQQPGVRLYR